MYRLKMGLFKADGGEGEYSANGTLVGTAKNQQNAYKTWAAANCTGLLKCRSVRFDDTLQDVYTKITVNIDAFVLSKKPD